MELADLDRVPACAGGHSSLLSLLLEVPRHQRRAMGELAHVRRGRMALVGGSQQGFRERSGLSRKDRRSIPCVLESYSRDFLRIRNVVCFAPTARSGGRAQSWGEGARIYSCRCRRKHSGNVLTAL